MKEVIAKILKKAIEKEGAKIDEKKIIEILETPPNPEMGDYAFPCFILAAQLKLPPNQIALNIRENIKQFPETDFEDIQTSGPYINFFENRGSLARKVLSEIDSENKNYGKHKIGKNKKVVVEFSSPNIGKPFGIGHLRSTIIGNSISNICEAVGYRTIKINYLGDWGTQFGKLIFGYINFGDEAKLNKDPVKHLQELYVKVSSNEKYDEEARQWFKKLEDGNKEAVVLWESFRDLSMKEFKKIYKIFGIDFDSYSGEYNSSKNQNEIIKLLEEKKLVERDQGALIVNLKKYNLGVCIIQKTDGATTYAARDLMTAITRYKEYNFEKMIYEVGQEQKLHFSQIFKVLELMGYSWAKNCTHISHGLYLDADGKKFATRKGKTILMGEIIDDTKKLAKKEIKKRDPKIKEGELEERAEKIAIASIFYGDLKNNRVKDIAFDLERFVSFEGDTGPYLQYSYARASSILRKTKYPQKYEIPSLKSKEIELIKKYIEFPDVVLKAYESMNPSLIANYSYQLAQTFNEFYHDSPVIGSKEEPFRIVLVDGFKQILGNASKLLGIQLLDEM